MHRRRITESAFSFTSIHEHLMLQFQSTCQPVELILLALINRSFITQITYSLTIQPFQDNRHTFFRTKL